MRHTLLCLVFALAGCASESVPAPPVIPAIPGLTEIAYGRVAYPADLERQGIEGWSVTDCAIDAGGVVHDCSVVDTTNHGFDAATLLITNGLRFRAARGGILPIAHFRHSITFRLSHGTRQATDAAPRWILTTEGCRVWNPHPVAGETVSWSGACADGFAEGPGRLVWKELYAQPAAFAAADPAGIELRTGSIYTGGMRRGLEQGDGMDEAFDIETGKPRYTIRGTLAAGRFEGHATMSAASGTTYDGDYHLGRKNGHGVTTYPTGMRYEGDFKDGWWDGQGYLTWGHGSSYRGAFAHGKLDGEGELTVPASDRGKGEDLSLKGTWKMNCLVSGSKVCVKLRF